jgi:hypothetical protein
LKSVEILIPEANLSSYHKTKTTSFRRCALAEADALRDFLLKTGLKSDFGPVEPEQGVAKSNWFYAVSSDIRSTLCAAPLRRSTSRFVCFCESLGAGSDAPH